MATEAQIDYAIALLKKNGFSIRFMDAKFKELGASMRERQGSVRNWLTNMEKAEISDLITKLKEMKP